MKLTPQQQAIVDKMRDGWELASNMTMEGGAWIQRGGAGRGGEYQAVNGNTFDALYKKGVIRQQSREFPTAIYVLTEEIESIA